MPNPNRNPEPEEFYRFPDDFLWGVATSSYQIEGAVHEDGRGLSIWDTFCQQPGKIYGGHTGDVAADHYHRWQEDIRLMADIGLKAYRFSIAWPRVQPEGQGPANPAGLAFYDRLVDGLLQANIQPFVTLYHWDLPQALQDRGGWPARETAYRFADYASLLADKLGDRVTWWITHNEPWVAAFAGHFNGVHAPGIQDPIAAFRAVHHLLLSHGLAAAALRQSARRPIQVGITLNLSSIHPASPGEADRQAAWRYDGILNRLFLDPLFKAHYPEDILQILQPLFATQTDSFRSEDLQTIAAPLDFLGVNYYSRNVVRYDPDFPFIQADTIQPELTENGELPEYSLMWEIYPPGIYELLLRLHQHYHPERLLITENGICVPDDVDLDGRVRDYRRIRYLRDHLIQVHRAMAAGVPLQGYFVWTLMDNFEWAHGYRMRFGLIYVDFETQQRIPKLSASWFANVIREGGFYPDKPAIFFPV